VANAEAAVLELANWSARHHAEIGAHRATFDRRR